MRKITVMVWAVLVLPSFPVPAGSSSPAKVQLAFFHGGGRKDVLDKEERELARTRLADLRGEVKLLLFTKEEGCKACAKAERFVEEISSLSPRVLLEVVSLSRDPGRAQKLGIERVPGMALLGPADPGIRYYGLPLGYEFEAFVEALAQVAEWKPDLKPETASGLAQVKKPVVITVFVTET